MAERDKYLLKTYGITLAEYERILVAQGGTCAVCHKPPKGVLHVDHEHVRGWKAMPPWMRRGYVRGLLCFQCNRYRVSKQTTSTAEATFKYLMFPPAPPVLDEGER